MKFKLVITRFFFILLILECSLQLELFLKSKKLSINSNNKLVSKNIHIWGGSILYLPSASIISNLNIKNEQVKQNYKALFTTIDAIKLAKKLEYCKEKGLIFLMAGLHEAERMDSETSKNSDGFSLLTLQAFHSLFYSHETTKIKTQRQLASLLTSLVNHYSNSGNIKDLFKIYYLKKQYKNLDSSKIYSQVINSNKKITSYFKQFDFGNLHRNDKTVFNKYLGLISQDNYELSINRSFSTLHRYIFQGSNEDIPQIFKDMDHLIVQAIKYCKRNDCSRLYSKLHGIYPIYDIVSAALIYSNLNIENLHPKEVKDNTYISLIILTNMLSKRSEAPKNQTKSIVKAWSKLNLNFNYEIIYETKNLTTYKANFDYNIQVLNSILETKNYKLVLLQYPGHDFNFIKTTAKKNNLSLISNDPAFLKSIDKDGFFHYFNDNLVYKTGHLNSTGNKIWSQYIGNTINSFL